MQEELEVMEAALEVLREADFSDYPKGLRHPKHADKLRPIRAKAARALQRFFRRQKRLVLASVKPALLKLTTQFPPSDEAAKSVVEADEDAQHKAARVIPDLLPVSITGGTSFDYSAALSSALTAGYEGPASELDNAAAITEDVVRTYLADHSLTKLSGGLDATTVQRLRNALAAAYDEGADYDGLVRAVKDEYSGFSTVRAGMIAQTEMNSAYNAGRKELGLDMGFNEKAWDPDGTACEELCVPNALQGWIPIDEPFGSGDDAPTAHPGCDCGLNVRFSADAA